MSGKDEKLKELGEAIEKVPLGIKGGYNALQANYIRDSIIGAKGQHLRIGQAIFAAISSTITTKSVLLPTHDDMDARIGHALFFIGDRELITALKEFADRQS